MTGKPLTLCADDFGLNPAVNRAVLALAERGRIHAVSCLTTGWHWPDDGLRLRRMTGIEVGLHLNFTEPLGDARPVYSLSRLLLLSWCRQLPMIEVRASIRRQWRAFRQVMGRDPDFIDGHRHVHQFPVIREALMAELRERQFAGWVRSLTTIPGPAAYRLKALTMAGLGAGSLRRTCRRNGIRFNPAFAGVYDFDPRADYPALMRDWLSRLPPNGLIMCHPANGNSERDLIADARQHEFDYLSSPEFTADCQVANARLISWSPGNPS